MRLKLSLTFLLAGYLSLLSCKVTFVPEYSATLEQQITNGAKMNDKLYLDLLKAEPNDRNYNSYKGRYTEIEAEINSIELENEARNNNNHFLAIIKELKTHFKDYEKEHKEKPTPLTDGEIKGYQAYIKAFWKPLLLAERGIKDKKQSNP
jgi:hypothetical protein